MFGISLIQYGMTGRWIGAVDNPGSGEPDFQGSKSDYWKKKDFEYPQIQISPELIFANEVQLLDANFISRIKGANEYIVPIKDNSILVTLRNLISGWYVTLRTIAIIGLLSVLIYIGIRIIISSTGEKAKYKERLMDWIIAFCLLFFMHYIMAGLTTVVEKVDEALSKAVNINSGLEIDSDYGTVKYTGNSGNSIGGGSTTTNFLGLNPQYTGMTDDEAVETARTAAENEGWTSEGWGLGGWSTPNTTVENIVGGIITRSTKEYTLKYEEGEIVIECIEEQQTIEGIVKNPTRVYNMTVIANPLSSSEDNEGGSVSGSTNFDIPVVKNKNGAYVSYEPGKVLYFINYARLFLNEKANDQYTGMATAYLIIYIALVVFTAVFAIRYIKRVIYIALLTLFAPMVALTYPIDKMKDGKAQAWNMWFKEYIFNLIIQPFHLLLYTVLIGSAIELATSSMIYAVVAIYMLIPAEKLLRKFFGFDNAGTLSAAGSFAGGALFSAMINKINKPKPQEPKDGDKGLGSRKPTVIKDRDTLVNPQDVIIGHGGTVAGSSGRTASPSGGASGQAAGSSSSAAGTPALGGTGGSAPNLDNTGDGTDSNVRMAVTGSGNGPTPSVSGGDIFDNIPIPANLKESVLPGGRRDLLKKKRFTCKVKFCSRHGKC